MSILNPPVDPRALARDRLERTVEISLPVEGKPYRREELVSCLVAMGVRGMVEAIGQRERNNEWDVTFKDIVSKAQFLNTGPVIVKGERAAVASVKKARIQDEALLRPHLHGRHRR